MRLCDGAPRGTRGGPVSIHSPISNGLPALRTARRAPPGPWPTGSGPPFEGPPTRRRFAPTTASSWPLGTVHSARSRRATPSRSRPRRCTTAGGMEATFTAGPPGAVRPSGPFGTGSPGATGDRAGDRPLSGAGLGGPALLSVLFVTHAHWLLRSYAQYSRQHPLHANAIPIYG